MGFNSSLAAFQRKTKRSVRMVRSSTGYDEIMLDIQLSNGYIYISIDKYTQISIIYIVYIVIMSMDIYKSIMDTVVIG